jgi:hypothetical protein
LARVIEEEKKHLVKLSSVKREIKKWNSVIQERYRCQNDLMPGKS